MTKFEAVADALLNKMHQLMSKTPYSDKPRLVIYMDRDYFYGGLAECIGPVDNSLVWEVCTQSTMLGYPVYKILPGPNTGLPPHPTFRIVEV